MAVLNEAARRGLLPLAFVATGLAVIGCSLGERLGWVEAGDDGLAFSHALHYGEEGLECSSCHPTWDSGDDPGMPTRAMCMLCHRGLDEEKPPERRIETLFDGEVYRAQRVSALDGEIVFSHGDHALDESLCGTCHDGIEESVRIDEHLAVTMDDCSACHANLGVANECATCHSRLGEDVAPWTHDDHWQRTHGRLFHAGSELTANRCEMCHEERDCNSCHVSVQPENHTNFWRQRGHALTAQMDRTGCYWCHRSDSCDSCHREVRPRTHSGAWGSPLNTHCLGCHLGATDEGCFTCHLGTPSHSLGSPQPPDHTPGMNCLQCHGVGAPLPHVHTGQDCTSCHP